MPSRDQFTTEIYVNNQQAQDALMELNQKLEKLQKSYANLNKNSKNYEQRERELAKQIKATEASIATAEKGTESYARAMNNLGKRSIEQLYKLQRQLNSEIRKLDPNDAEFAQLSKNYQTVTQRIIALETAQKGVLASQGGFFKRMTVGLSKYYGALMVGVGTVKKVANSFMESYKTISDFQQANADLSTILGVNVKQMGALTENALALGRSTEYTASQVTQLQTELAKLGFSQGEIIDMSKSVLEFATAVGADLPAAAAMAGVALRSFDLSTKDSEDAMATMAVACSKSALSFEYLQNAFSTIAPVAKTYGLSLKDTIALLGTLANAGFDASSAATATRNILLNLSDTSGKLATRLGGAKTTFEDIMKAFIELRNDGVDLNSTLELTDKRSVAAFNTFLRGAEDSLQLRSELENLNGELHRISEERLNTVEGSIKLMQSAWEGFILSMSNSTGTIKKVIDLLTKGIERATYRIGGKEGRENAYAGMFLDKNAASTSLWKIAESAKTNVPGLPDEKEVNKAFDAYEQQYVSKIKGLEARISYSESPFAKRRMRKELATLNEQLEGFRQAREKFNFTDMLSPSQQEQTAIEQKYDDLFKKLNEDTSLSIDERADQWTKLFAQKQKEILSIGKAEETASNNSTQLSEKELAARKKAYSEKSNTLKAQLNYEEKALKVSLLKKEISETEYETRLRTAQMRYFEERTALAKKYGQDDTAIMNEYLDIQIKTLEKASKDASNLLQPRKIVERDANGNPVEDKTKENMNNRIAGQQREDEILGENLKEAKALIAEDNWKEEYDFEIWKLEQLKDLELLSAEETEKAKLQVKLKYAQKAAENVQKVTELASNFVSQLQSAETANLEAEYQARLTAAGDNAEQREQIEAEYEAKKLDLQKKYADVDMVINIAKAVAAGALAAVQAYAAAEGNPVLGAIFAGMIAATTAAEIATIIAQRNAIKNTSAGASGGGSGSLPSGTRTVNGGYAEGGYTGQGGKYEPAGIVHRGEWVAPKWMVRQNPVTFANLERYRRSGSGGRSGNASRGFADGGYATATSTGSVSEAAGAPVVLSKESAQMIADMIAAKGITIVQLDKALSDKHAQESRFKKVTSR